MNNAISFLLSEARQNTDFVGREHLKRAKRLYPLTRLMRFLGDGEHIRSGWHPCHLCKSPGALFGMFQPGGRWAFSCTGGCGTLGDQVDYLKAKFGLSVGEAIRFMSKLVYP
jgi:hypothetical protein